MMLFYPVMFFQCATTYRQYVTNNYFLIILQVVQNLDLMTALIHIINTCIFFFVFQSQKEELDSALRAVAVSGDEKGKADLEKENTKLKEELSSLPELKKELEILRARVTELNQLTGMMWQT